jgi:hypothetical protein
MFWRLLTACSGLLKIGSMTEDEFARELELLRGFAAEYDKARSARKDWGMDSLTRSHKLIDASWTNARSLAE